MRKVGDRRGKSGKSAFCLFPSEAGQDEESQGKVGDLFGESQLLKGPREAAAFFELQRIDTFLRRPLEYLGLPFSRAQEICEKHWRISVELIKSEPKPLSLICNPPY